MLCKRVLELLAGNNFLNELKESGTRLQNHGT